MKRSLRMVLTEAVTLVSYRNKDSSLGVFQRNSRISKDGPHRGRHPRLVQEQGLVPRGVQREFKRSVRMVPTEAVTLVSYRNKDSSLGVFKGNSTGHPGVAGWVM